MVHLKYKVSTCEPETEFNKLAGGKALATDHRVNFTYFSHNYDKYYMSRDIPECSRIASSRRSVGQGAVQKTAREKIKNARREEARERLWENLTKGRSGIPGSPCGVYALFRFISIAKYVSKCWLSVRGTKFEIFREYVSKKG